MEALKRIQRFAWKQAMLWMPPPLRTQSQNRRTVGRLGGCPVNLVDITAILQSPIELATVSTTAVTY